MVSKQDLGLGYLVSVGGLLLIGLIGYFVIAAESPFGLVVTTLIGVALAGTVVVIGVWLFRGDFPEEYTWTIAQWTAIGLGFTTLFSLLMVITPFYFPTVDQLPGLFATNIVAGSLIGILIGSVVELRQQYHRTVELNQYNTVMNRVLRHNLRNDLNLILGTVEELNANNISTAEAVASIRQKATEMVNLSESARKIETLLSEDQREAIDIVEATDRLVAGTRGGYPEVEWSIELPEQAVAHVSSLVHAVIEEVIENAIEHNDGDPRVEISVTTSGEWVVVRVGDNGPPIPEHQITILSQYGETPIEHSNGLGLWFVQWFINQHDGELAIEPNDPRGNIVTMRLPAADAAVDAGGSDSVGEAIGRTWEQTIT